jgi:hypothetical protein
VTTETDLWGSSVSSFRVLQQCVWLFLVAATCRPVLAKTRVALVVTGEHQRVKNALTLAESSLSKLEGVDLLERGEIGRVLAEQQLAVANIADPEQAMRIGKLLRVDVFGVLETDPRNTNLLGLVVFDALTGVRLWDKAVSGDSIEDVSVRIVDGVQRAITKQQDKSRNVHTIGILSVRNADLPRGMDTMVQSLGHLLERSLTTSPQLAVLERDRLLHVIEERRLPTERPLPPLLTSLFLVELEISRGKTAAQYHATARATNLAGKPVATWNAAADEPYKLVEELQKNIVRDLRLKPANEALDSVLEADRYSRESLVLWEHHEFARAVLPAEAAVSLDPENIRHLRALLFRLWDAAVELVDPGEQRRIGPPRKPIDPDKLAASIELARHAIALQTEFVRRLSASPKWPANAEEAQVVTDRAYLSKIVHLDEQAPKTSQTIVRNIVDEYRELQFVWLGEKMFQSATDEEGFRRYTSWVSSPAMRDVFQRFEPIRDDWAADVLKLVTTWATLADEFHPSRHPQLHASTEFVLSTLRHGERYKELDESEYGLLKQSHDFLISCSDPVLRLHGKLLTLQLGQQTGKMKPSEIRRGVEQLANEAWTLIENEDQAIPAELRLRWVNFALEVHQLVPWNERLGLNERLFKLAASHGIYSQRLFESTSAGYRRLRTPEEHLRLIDDALKFVRSGGAGLDDSAARIETARIQQRREAVLKEMQKSPPTVTPWKTVRALIDVNSRTEGVRAIIRPAVLDRNLYALGMAWDRERGQVSLTLLEIDVDSDAMVKRGTFTLDKLPVPEPGASRAADRPLGLPSVVLSSPAEGRLFFWTAIKAHRQ